MNIKMNRLQSRLGHVFQDQELLTRALAIRREKFGPRHLDVAHSLPSLAAVHEALGQHDEALRLAGEALTGGVSSDIWRIDTRRGPVCAKRALARLREHLAFDLRAAPAEGMISSR